MTIKIYFSGKILPNSSFKTSYWRNEICAKLSKESGLDIKKLDPLERDCDEGDSKYIVGQNSNYIEIADFVIVWLTDDISVGGSQEIMIAKHYNTPVIGIAKIDGKFVKSKKEINGKIVYNWKHPYVDIFCDVIVNDLIEAAQVIRNFDGKGKGLLTVDECRDYYLSKKQ